MVDLIIPDPTLFPNGWMSLFRKETNPFWTTLFFLKARLLYNASFSEKIDDFVKSCITCPLSVRISIYNSDKS
jgi:hypothetical protein